MKIPEVYLKGNKDPALVDFMDYTMNILNQGRYQLRTVSSPPTWTGEEGEMVMYASGTNRGIYFYINSQWSSATFSQSTGQNLLLLGSGNNIISGDTTNGFWVGDEHFADAPFSITMAGVLKAVSGTIGGFTLSSTSLTAGTGSTSVGLAPATYPFYAGHGTPASAPFYVTNEGVIKAASGTIGGWTLAATTLTGTGTPNLILNSATSTIQSSDYASGALGSGWSIGPLWAEFNNIRARGKFATAVFEKDTISSVGGNLLVSDSDILNADMTALDASTLTILGDTTFAVNDFLRIKDGVDDEWLKVTVITSAPTYTVERDKAAVYALNTNPIWKKGTAVINYGVSGEGLIYMTASDTNSPHIDVLTHAGSPWATTTTRLRIGNVNGFLGAATDLYGIYIGESDKYLKYDPTNGLQIKGTITVTGGNATQTFAQASIPTSIAIGDTWIDTDDSNKTYMAQMVGANEIAAGEWVEVGGAGGVTTFAQDAIPTSTSIGDIWYDTNDSNKQYRAASVGADAITAGEWVIVRDSAATTLDTWRSGSDTTMIDGGDIYTGTVTADKITVDSAIDVGDGSVIIDGTNDCVSVFSDTVTITAGVNDDLDWTEDGSTFTCDLDASTTYTPTTLAAEVQAEMRATASADADTTCTYSSTTRKITIANSTLTTLTFKWSSGANTLTTCGKALGFNVTADDTGALTYTADNECALRVKMGKLS